MKNKKIIIIVASIVVVITLIMGVIFIGIPAYLNYTARKAMTDMFSEESNNSSENEEESTEDLEKKLEEQTKKSFNEQYLVYETKEGETSTASNVIALLNMVKSNNLIPSDRVLDVNGTVITTENIEEWKSMISENAKYKIKCILDDEGYVKTIELKYSQE